MKGDANNMNLIPVKSSSIAAIGYDPDSLTLRLAFRSGGIYDYYGVPPQIADQFLHAASKGKYYSMFIKGHFNPMRIQ